MEKIRDKREIEEEERTDSMKVTAKEKEDVKERRGREQKRRAV